MGKKEEGWEMGGRKEGTPAFQVLLSLKFSEWELGNPSQEKKVIQVVTKKYCMWCLW